MGIEDDIKEIKFNISAIELRLEEIHLFLFEKKHGTDRTDVKQETQDSLKLNDGKEVDLNGGD